MRFLRGEKAIQSSHELWVDDELLITSSGRNTIRMDEDQRWWWIDTHKKVYAILNAAKECV